MPGPGRAAVALALCATACQSPSADVLAVWLDAAVDEDGARAIQIYDSGERRQIELRPTIADSNASQVTLGVAPGGDGFAVSAVKGGSIWIDLRRSTRGVIGRGPWGELAPDALFSRSGRALLRGLAEDGPSDQVLLPIASTRTEALWLRAPQTEHLGGRGFLRSASDAPIVYWLEDGGSEGVEYVDGTIAAYAYPSDDARIDVVALVLLGKNRIHTRAIASDAFPRRIPKDVQRRGWCTHSLCVTPDGDAAIGISPTFCQLLRFQWARVGSDGESRPAREIDLPLGCGWESEPHLLAALDASHVLLDDDERVYLADLDAGLWTATPKLGASTTQVYMLAADGGRTMNLVSTDGTLIRADADGIDVVSAERTLCDPSAAPITSPNGAWVMLTCHGSEAIVEIEPAFSTTLRISALGLERFDGLAMRALAIDDGGNALMYSYDPDDNEAVPRGLFVLEGDGRLSRVDELEPTPEAIGGSTMTYFSAQAR
jgi:hypothetical protein